MGDDALRVLTRLRRLRLCACGRVAVDAVRRLRMLRHLDVAVCENERSAVAEGWRQLVGRSAEPAMRARMPQLEDVRVSLYE